MSQLCAENCPRSIVANSSLPTRFDTFPPLLRDLNRRASPFRSQSDDNSPYGPPILNPPTKMMNSPFIKSEERNDERVVVHRASVAARAHKQAGPHHILRAIVTVSARAGFREVKNGFQGHHWIE